MSWDKNMVGKKITTLVDFDFISYTDIGLYTLIKDKYMIPSIFDVDILNIDSKMLLFASFERSNSNPLSIIVSDNANVDIDKLYEDLKKKYSEYIVENGFIKNSILDFLSVAMRYNTKNVGVSVLSHDQYEKACVEHLFSDDSFYTHLDIDHCKKDVLSSFDSYYVKDFEFFKRYELLHLTAKAIYVQSLRYNTDKIVNKDNDESEYYDILNNNKIFIVNLGNLKNMEDEEEYNGA